MAGYQGILMEHFTYPGSMVGNEYVPVNWSPGHKQEELLGNENSIKEGWDGISDRSKYKQIPLHRSMQMIHNNMVLLYQQQVAEE